MNAERARLVQALHLQRKPFGFICIVPTLLPKILAVPLRLTLCTNVNAAKMVDATGAIHVTCPVDDIVIAGDNNIITTPAYMQENPIAEVEKRSISSWRTCWNLSHEAPQRPSVPLRRLLRWLLRGCLALMALWRVAIMLFFVLVPFTAVMGVRQIDH